MEALALLERVGAPGEAGSEEFPATVYLEGPDEAVKAAFLAQFRRAWARAVPEAAEARVLRPDESGVDAILAAYQNVSLFAPRELTIVFEVEDVGRSDKRVEALAFGLTVPAGGSCLILVESVGDTVRKALEPLRSACAVRVVAEPPGEEGLLRWGALRLAADERRAEPGALEALLESCEHDALAFLNEVGKLALLAGADGVVTRAHVASLVAPQVGAELPDFLAAVAAGHAPMAAQRLERLLAAGESEGGVLWALGHLVSATFTMQASAYGWAKWRPQSQVLAGRRDDRSRARALDAVYRAEAAWKGGRLDARTALEQATREVVAR